MCEHPVLTGPAVAVRAGLARVDLKEAPDLPLLEAKADELQATPAFRYHPDHNTYGEGALSHQAVLHVAAWLLRKRLTLQRIVKDRHPLLLLDESQGTMRGVLDAVFDLTSVRPGHFTLGLLGDHRQRIYTDGHADLPSHIPLAWARPALQMNHRSQERIVRIINAIWEADIEGRTQPKTGVVQHPRSEKQGGKVRIFIGDTARTRPAKLSAEADCAGAMAQVTNAEAWTADQKGLKTLALEHKLGAKRGDFYEVYCGMVSLDKEAATPDPNGERMARPVKSCVNLGQSCWQRVVSLLAIRRSSWLLISCKRLPVNTGHLMLLP